MWAYFGTAAVLWGAKKIGDESIVGWRWFILGDLLWIVEGVKIMLASGNPSIIICETLFLFLHARGYYQWKRKLRTDSHAKI